MVFNKRVAVRWLFLIHRYLGIGAGLLMVMWCLSGFVMLYVSFPVLPEPDRLAAVSPIDWARCCRADKLGTVAVDAPVGAFRIEMLDGHPAALVQMEGQSQLVDLESGRRIDPVGETVAATVANAFARAHHLPQRAHFDHVVTFDQWTTSEHFNHDRPLYRFSWSDPAGTQIYVSSVNGRARQITTQASRFWNWLGAIPHWVYFTGLRQNETAWSQFIIWTSIIGTFLTATGIYIGIRQFTRRPKQRWSPYRGIMFWHHLPGLVFGVFTLTFVISGLFSMTPFGFLEGGGARTERRALQGVDPRWPALHASLEAIAARNLPDIASLDLAPLNGHVFFVATRSDGKRFRIDADGQVAPLVSSDLKRVAGQLAGATGLVQPSLLSSEDEFYFDHHSEPISLPVWRVVLKNDDRTRYYLDPVSGDILKKVDGSERWYRWLHQGLHRLDFTPFMRSRPVWDILMWVLMLGVTFVCATGSYVAIKRIIRPPRASVR